MVDRAIESRRVAQELRIGAFQVSHGFGDIDPRRSVQDLEENSSAFEPQIQQRKIDIVKAAQTGLQRIARTLLLFQPHAHLPQIFLGAPTLAVPAPVYLL